MRPGCRLLSRQLVNTISAQTQPAVRILGSRVDAVSFAQAETQILGYVAARRFAHVVTFGSEMAMLAARDPSYAAVINAADLVVPDTIGVVYAARLLGTQLHGRVAGVELADKLCARCALSGISVFLLGAAPGVADEAARAWGLRFPGLRIAGTQHGYFPETADADVVAAIRASGAQLVLVALGFPKQEFWIRTHAAALGPVVCMGVGGTFDVIAGRVARAPRLMRGLGLEWFYRLVREPQRLGRQMVLPQFAVSVISQAWHERAARRS